MARLTQKERAEVLMIVGYGGRLRSHEEVCVICSTKYILNDLQSLEAQSAELLQNLIKQETWEMFQDMEGHSNT